MKIERVKVRRIYPRAFINYGPGLVLKTECSWRKFNGIGWYFNGFVYFLHLRYEG